MIILACHCERLVAPMYACAWRAPAWACRVVCASRSHCTPHHAQDAYRRVISSAKYPTQLDDSGVPAPSWAGWVPVLHALGITSERGRSARLVRDFLLVLERMDATCAGGGDLDPKDVEDRARLLAQLGVAVQVRWTDKLVHSCLLTPKGGGGRMTCDGHGTLHACVHACMGQGLTAHVHAGCI